jgi:CO/xanthine dehydrogenase Mo-binding subunit
MHEIVRPNEFVGRNQDRKEFKVVGNRDIRIPGGLSYALATGAAKFSRDVVRPGMLHAKFLRSPYPHARIKRMDTRKAKALPGVKAVVTCEDEEIKALPLISVMYKIPFSPFTPRFGSLIVLSNEAEREGDEVGVCIAAESEELCDEALKLVEIEWELLPFALDPMEALATGDPILHPELSPGTNCSFESGWEDGNAEAGFREADHIIEYDRGCHGLNNHVPNPYTVVAWWEQDPLGTEGETLYMEGNQHNPLILQLRDIFNLPEDKVRWLTVCDGGSFCDFNARRLSILAPLLAKRTRRPVRIA